MLAQNAPFHGTFSQREKGLKPAISIIVVPVFPLRCRIPLNVRAQATGGNSANMFAGGLCFVVALGTISRQGLKAAFSDPVQSLRAE